MAGLLGQPLALKVNPRLFKSRSLGSFLNSGTEAAADNTDAGFSSFLLGEGMGVGSTHAHHFLWIDQ